MKLKLVSWWLRMGWIGMLAGGSFSAHAGTPTDACSLLTTAEVSAALGVQVDPGERVVASSPLMCGWKPVGSKGFAEKRVVASIITVTSFDHEKNPLQGIKETQVSGLGDEAHSMTTPGFGTGLSVKKTNFAFKIRVYGFSQAELEAKEKSLAQSVLGKL